MKLNIKRIEALEREMRYKPNKGCMVISFEDHPLNDEKRKEYTDQGINIIDVSWH